MTTANLPIQSKQNRSINKGTRSIIITTTSMIIIFQVYTNRSSNSLKMKEARLVSMFSESRKVSPIDLSQLRYACSVELVLRTRTQVKILLRIIGFTCTATKK